MVLLLLVGLVLRGGVGGVSGMGGVGLLNGCCQELSLSLLEEQLLLGWEERSKLGKRKRRDEDSDGKEKEM